jgi:hypothetical protein
MRLRKKSKEELNKLLELRRSNAAGAVTSKKHYIRAREKGRINEDGKE